jgi:hypothetical protein
VTTLAQYIGDAAAGADAEFIAECKAEADALITAHTAGNLRAGYAELPAPILARATLEVGADLFHRRQARNGVAGFEGEQMAPVRVRNDPMGAAYATLRPFLKPAIA